MADNFKESAVIIRQERIAAGIYSLWLNTSKIAKFAKPGQFISVYCKDGSRILPRPISICEIDKDNNAIRIVYRIAGAGTREIADYGTGTTLEILGPLGNGFPVKDKKAMIIGGGIGIPPMLQLAKELKGEKLIVVGYKDETFLDAELGKFGNIYIATEDGSAGTKGNVMNAIAEHQLKADIIYACGPTPMLKAIQRYGREHEIETWLSMEERMACGIGACLACVCKSKDKDEHTHVHNKRICKDGPVFSAQEVEF